MANVSFEKKENEFSSQEEKMGFFQKSCIFALIALVQDGAGKEILMEIHEKIESFNSTAWSLLALCATGSPTEHTDSTIGILDAQLYSTWAELQAMAMELNELRKNNTLKKAKTTND